MHKSRTVTCGIVTTIVIVVPVIAVASRRSCYLYCCHHCKNVDNYRPNYKGNNIKDQGNMSFRLSPLQITICLSVTSLYRYIYIHKVVFTIINILFTNILTLMARIMAGMVHTRVCKFQQISTAC